MAYNASRLPLENLSNANRVRATGMSKDTAAALESINAEITARQEIVHSLGSLTLEQLQEVRDITSAMVGEENSNG